MNKHHHIDPDDFVLEIFHNEQPLFVTLKIDAVWDHGFLDDVSCKVKEIRDADDNLVPITKELKEITRQEIENNNEEIIGHIYERNTKGN